MASPRQLIEGFKRFREKHFAIDDTLYRQLVEEGQAPKILVVACCDARVDPAIVLDCSPGDLFVIRNVANIVPPSENHGGHHGTCAALEFGVVNLGVEHIIVLGHAHCGGIRTLMEAGGTPDSESFIDEWMLLAEKAREEVEKEMSGEPLEKRAQACEQRALLTSLHNLKTFPWVRERVDSGKLSLHGWYFDIEHGLLQEYDASKGKFIAL